MRHNGEMSQRSIPPTSSKVNSRELAVQWRHNERDGVSNHLILECLLNRLFRRRSKKTSKLRVTGICQGNPPVTAGFPSQRASNTENVSIWWRYHGENLAAGIAMHLPHVSTENVCLNHRKPSKIKSWAYFMGYTVIVYVRDMRF